MWFYTLVKIILVIIGVKALYNLFVHGDKPMSGTEAPTHPTPPSLTAAEVYDRMMEKMRDGK
jgi:hypothetical protein